MTGAGILPGTIAPMTGTIPGTITPGIPDLGTAHGTAGTIPGTMVGAILIATAITAIMDGAIPSSIMVAAMPITHLAIVLHASLLAEVAAASAQVIVARLQDVVPSVPAMVIIEAARQQVARPATTMARLVPVVLPAAQAPLVEVRALVAVVAPSEAEVAEAAQVVAVDSDVTDSLEFIV